MRLLIYLLAMMTGFSAAEAARPLSVTPATLGSAVSQAAIIAASIPSENDATSTNVLGARPRLSSALVSENHFSHVEPLFPTSPVIRHDVSLQ